MNHTHVSHSYPLMKSMVDALQAASGRSLSEITLDAVWNDQLSVADLCICESTLYAQAEIARQAGHPQLAVNLIRAAELTRVPNEELLYIYDALRPGRTTYDELEALAENLENKYNASTNAQFIREAAAVYQARGLFRREER